MVSAITNELILEPDESPFVDEYGEILPELMVNSCNFSINGPKFKGGDDTPHTFLQVEIDATKFDCEEMEKSGCEFGLYSGNIMSDPTTTLTRELIAFPSENHRRLCNNGSWVFNTPWVDLSMTTNNCPPIPLTLIISLEQENTFNALAFILIVLTIFCTFLIVKCLGKGNPLRNFLENSNVSCRTPPPPSSSSSSITTRTTVQRPSSELHPPHYDDLGRSSTAPTQVATTDSSKNVTGSSPPPSYQDVINAQNNNNI